MRATVCDMEGLVESAENRVSVVPKESDRRKGI